MTTCAVNEASGKRVYAIGDIHGCPDETSTMLRHLEEHQGINDDDLVIFLGDYIDRGPNSKVVVELMIDFKRRFPRTRFLKGNHEDMLLDFLGFGGRFGEGYIYNGGLETIQSYGISVFAPPEEMINTLPPEHFKFLCDLESIIKVGDFIFAHGGLNPLRDIHKQNDGDVLWIREEFITNIHPFKSLIIFGHTPHQEILMHLPYKVGIDTGLVFGNKLTCLEVITGEAMQIYRGQNEIILGNIVLK